MTGKPLTQREKSVRRHNISTVLSAAAFAFYAAGVLPGITVPSAARLIALPILFLGVIVMYRTRNADEYIAAIWRSGTSVAFVATVAVMFFAPALEGFIDGITESLTEQPTGPDLPYAELLAPVAIASFYIANLWARLRGTY